MKKILKLSLLLTFLAFWSMGNPAEAANAYKIVIDPAHGGTDGGVKITEKINEKDVTLAIARFLHDELSREANLKVTLTRNEDEEVSAGKRREIINAHKPDFLISIHVNRGFAKNASGFELYYPGFGRDEKGGRKALQDLKPEKVQHLNSTIRMAQLIQRNLDSIFPRQGRGLREAEMPVFEGLAAPALVIEIGFASNPDERKKLLSEKTQLEIAQALSKSIKSFYR
jgi:N-acetylmuramoyl-L-alanine amidase